MVEPIALSVAGMVASKLLEQVMEATKIAISCNECCKVLHALLKELQPIVDHAVRQISQSNFDNAFKRPRSAVHDWLDELEGTLKRAAVEVNKCIKQQPDLNPVSRYNTGKRILDVTESVKKLLQQASFVGLVVTFSESSRAQKMEKMMQEIHQMIYDLGATAQRIEFATVAQESLQENCTTSSAQGITSAIKSALHNLLHYLSLGPSDNMSRVGTGASTSSSCPRELIVNEDAHKLSDIQEVPQLVFGLDNFTMRLQQSITSSSIDAKPRCVGVWGMGGAGKTLLAQIAYNSREVREHFKEGKLIWLTVSQTPNIKGLYDSFCRQLGLMPMSFAQLEEYRTRLYNEFLRRRVFLVLDDVWNKGVLEQLDLAKGRGSVTLVTSRNQLVLKKAGVIDEDELQGVAELVADECKGLPLALKVIGGLMVGKTTCPEWEFQLNCLRESRKLPEQQEEEKLFGRLKLSYDNLDNDNPVSKECFLGFAAFPEDRVVEIKELIKLWKGQGLLDDGTKMFGDDFTRFAYYLVGLLVARSLIEVAGNEEDEVDETNVGDDCLYGCKVHDVMRDLALHIIEGEKPITCLYRPGKKLVEFPRDWIRTFESELYEVRNLSLMENDLTTLNDVIFSAPKLEVLLLSKNRGLKVMPKQFWKGIKNLKHLDLSNCYKLESLPGEIGNLRQLTHLHLKSCGNLKSLPRKIGNLRQLTHLDLHHCDKLESLPKEIGKLTQLTHLDLQHCDKLESLPRKIGNLRQLTHLDLHHCDQLESLPKEIGKLTQLTHLDLQHCDKLKSLPRKIGNLRQLTHLDLHHCDQLESLPKEVGKLTQLVYLNLSFCSNLKYHPSTVDDLRSLQYLNLEVSSPNGCSPSTKIQVQAFAAYICKLTTRTELHMSGKTCGILEQCDQLLKLVSKLDKLKSFHIRHFYLLETLPDAIQSMVHLEEFSVSNCVNIKILPSVITLFSKLKVLLLKNMFSLESLPALNTLKMLSTLRISCCGFKKLPDSFTSSGAFPSLKILDCLRSGLVEFPEVEDGAMPKLQILNLDCTNIESLPDTLIYLKNLKVVYIWEGRFDDLCEKFENTWLSGKFRSKEENHVWELLYAQSI
ncbi:hypothetical protein CY35_10G019000 [Sphagnum magellanicum]|nr:hypothetical protein CY35_10G019000 [Sphagnum magellanicum]